MDETTRASMWKLRTTWNDVFSAKKLHNLDVKVNAMDPAWPISIPSDVPQSSATSIHVNPKFLSMVRRLLTFCLARSSVALGIICVILKKKL